jgi:hypothetical protein
MRWFAPDSLPSQGIWNTTFCRSWIWVIIRVEPYKRQNPLTVSRLLGSCRQTLSRLMLCEVHLARDSANDGLVIVQCQWLIIGQGQDSKVTAVGRIGMVPQAYHLTTVVPANYLDLLTLIPRPILLSLFLIIIMIIDDRDSKMHGCKDHRAHAERGPIEGPAC